MGTRTLNGTKQMGNKPIKIQSGELHKGQIRCIKQWLSVPTKFNLCNSSRQSGKSFLLKNLVTYYSINHNGSHSLVVTPFVSQVLKIYDELIEVLKPVIKSSNKTDKVITLINNSKVYFKSAENHDSIRGGTYDYLFLDEFAYFREDAYELSILPTIATKKNSRVFIFSTPRGKNKFYELCVRGWSESIDDDDYSYCTMSYTDNPLYDIQFVEECRKRYPVNKFEQEFECKFHDGGTVFNIEGCDTITDWIPVDKDEVYYGGLDLARKGDSTVLTIMNTKNEMVYSISLNKTKWKHIVDKIVDICQTYNNCELLVETNSIGDVIYELLENKYNKVTGIFTSNSNKEQYIDTLSYYFNDKKIKIPTRKLDPQLHNELETFELTFSPKTRKTVYSAKPGYHDDKIISLALALKHKLDLHIEHTGGRYKQYIGGQWV